VKPIAAPVLAGFGAVGPQDAASSLIAAVALCYLPYSICRLGVLGFLTKGYLPEEGSLPQRSLAVVALAAVFGEHQGDVVAYVVLAALVLTSTGLSVARRYLSHHRVQPCRQSTRCYSSLVVVVAQLSWYFLVITPLCALVAPRQRGSFSIGALCCPNNS